MKSSYFIDEKGEVQGPLTQQQLNALYHSGRITAATKVCEEGTENWQPYYKAAGEPTPEIEQAKKVKSVPTAEPTHFENNDEEFEGITKTQGRILIALFLLGLMGIGAPFFSSLKPTPSWEYETVEIEARIFDLKEASSGFLPDRSNKSVPELSGKLASMGSEGWELVSCFLEHQTSHPNFGEKKNLVTGLQPNTRPQKLVLIFKRHAKR
jgi:hypothetical protein